jgi:hypothetical protein
VKSRDKKQAAAYQGETPSRSAIVVTGSGENVLPRARSVVGAQPPILSSQKRRSVPTPFFLSQIVDGVVPCLTFVDLLHVLIAARFPVYRSGSRFAAYAAIAGFGPPLFGGGLLARTFPLCSLYLGNHGLPLMKPLNKWFGQVFTNTSLKLVAHRPLATRRSGQGGPFPGCSMTDILIGTFMARDIEHTVLAAAAASGISPRAVPPLPEQYFPSPAAALQISCVQVQLHFFIARGGRRLQ